MADDTLRDPRWTDETLALVAKAAFVDWTGGERDGLPTGDHLLAHLTRTRWEAIAQANLRLGKALKITKIEVSKDGTHAWFTVEVPGLASDTVDIGPIFVSAEEGSGYSGYAEEGL